MAKAINLQRRRASTLQRIAEHRTSRAVEEVQYAKERTLIAITVTWKTQR
jgi:hypothetical protein